MVRTEVEIVAAPRGVSAAGSRSGPGRSPTPGAVRDAVDEAVRRQMTRLTGRELERLDVRVKVLRVTQLARYLP